MIIDWKTVRIFVKPGATDRDCCATGFLHRERTMIGALAVCGLLSILVDAMRGIPFGLTPMRPFPPEALHQETVVLDGRGRVLSSLEDGASSFVLLA